MSTSRIGTYVYADWDKDDYSVKPLLEALSFAIGRNRAVTFFLDGIFLDKGPTGGDPGWVIERRPNGPDGKTAWVYLSSDYSYEEQDEFWYDEVTVKRYVHQILQNVVVATPDRANEVAAAIDKYGL